MSNLCKEIITDEMMNFFNKRTLSHIGMVQKYCQKIYEIDKIKYEQVMQNAVCHDQSKFNNPELYPYIVLTCKFAKEDYKIPK